jgi:hypothetical protein
MTDSALLGESLASVGLETIALSRLSCFFTGDAREITLVRMAENCVIFGRFIN